MICKGNTHNDGSKLARYLSAGKNGERTEVWELCGFAAGDIREAFRSIHVEAEATRCEKPFFHVQVRNPDGEELSRPQWLIVIDRIETKLGLTNQPRAICFHIDEKTGHEHMHVAWSRIDAETMTARPLPFFKERLRDVARELEKTLHLTRVPNERADDMKAPSRSEFEQARRLGVDIKEVRHAIRNCFEQSDNGRSFEAALLEQGFVLAQGDRRAFVVIDHEGGIHALGKRILDLTAAGVRERLADLSRDELPTVKHAQSLVREHQLGRNRTGPDSMPDRDLDEAKWQQALERAAIDKEKIERRFVESKPSRNAQPGSREQEGRTWEQTASTPSDQFQDARLEMAGSTGPRKPLRHIEKELWDAYRSSPAAKDFAKALDNRGIAFASVSRDEAYKSYCDAQFAKAIGRTAPVYREGEIVVVRPPSPMYLRAGEWTELNPVQRLDQAYAKKYLDILGLDKSKLKAIEATKAVLKTRAQDRAEHWDAIRLENAQRKARRAPSRSSKTRKPPGLATAAGRSLDLVGDALESLFAPKLTPEQKRAGERRMAERAAAAEAKIEFEQLMAERKQERRRLEEEQEARRQRDERDRER